MSKELINEIESKIAWNDKNIDETSISLKDVKRLLNELEKQAERVEEYRSSLEHGAMVAVKTAEKLHHQQQENKRYREALEFYADKENYRGYLTAGGWVKTPVNDDDGEKARQALEGEE